MKLQQAQEMLNKIKTAKLDKKNPHARELARELEAYIKSAKTKKKAYLDMLSQSDDFAKNFFAYWATAALKALKDQGASKLQSVELELPRAGEKASEFGARILRGGGGGTAQPMSRQERMRNLLTRNKSTQNEGSSKQGQLINALWKKIGPQVMKGVNSAVSHINHNYGEDGVALTWASEWALALDGHGTGGRADALPYPKIEAAAQNTENLASDVFGAIDRGVLKTLKMHKRWIDKDTAKGVSTSTQTLEDKELGDLLTSEDPDALEEILNQEQLEDIKENFMDGEYDFNPTAKKKIRQMLLDANMLTLEEEEGQKLYMQFLQGEFDQDPSKKDEMFTLLISEGWITQHLDLSDSAEEAVDTIEETATELAERAVASTNVPGTGELRKTLVQLAQINLSIEALKGISDLLQRQDFHWLFDSHLYLQDEWVKMVQEFDGPAMALLQETIEAHKEPLLGLGFRYLLNESTFANKQKMIKIKEFADNCMDQKLLKSKISGVNIITWYLSCAASLDGGIPLTVGGKSVLVSVPTFKGVVSSSEMWKGLCTHAPNMTPSEIEQAKKKMVEMITPIIPSAHNKLAINVGKFMDLIVKYSTALDKQGLPMGGRGAKEAYKQSKGGAQLFKQRGFFGHLASELIRYRFYLDLNIDQASAPAGTVPKTLGNADCDNRVKDLMGPIPSSSVAGVKTEMYEDALAPEWAERVQEEIAKRVKVMTTTQGKLSDATQKLFEALGIEEGDEIYEAYVQR